MLKTVINPEQEEAAMRFLQKISEPVIDVVNRHPTAARSLVIAGATYIVPAITVGPALGLLGFLPGGIVAGKLISFTLIHFCTGIL